MGLRRCPTPLAGASFCSGWLALTFGIAVIFWNYRFDFWSWHQGSCERYEFLAYEMYCTSAWPHGHTTHLWDLSGRSTTRAEDAQGTPTQSHISPSILVYEDQLEVRRYPRALAGVCCCSGWLMMRDSVGSEIQRRGFIIEVRSSENSVVGLGVGAWVERIMMRDSVRC